MIDVLKFVVIVRQKYTATIRINCHNKSICCFWTTYNVKVKGLTMRFMANKGIKNMHIVPASSHSFPKTIKTIGEIKFQVNSADSNDTLAKRRNVLLKVFLLLFIYL